MRLPQCQTFSLLADAESHACTVPSRSTYQLIASAATTRQACTATAAAVGGGDGGCLVFCIGGRFCGFGAVLQASSAATARSVHLDTCR
jgi:hypothetical protein